MSELETRKTLTPFALSMLAEEQDEALMDVIQLAIAARGGDLTATREALSQIHEIVKIYLGE